MSIEIDDKAIARAAAGETVELKGVAKADGPGRPVTTVATPIDAEHGALIIVLQEGEKRFRFLADYKFLVE